MSGNLNIQEYERKITPIERLFTRSPYSIVTLVARIKGNVSEEMLLNAVAKIQQRHVNLRVRIMDDKNHAPWFTSSGVKEIPVEIVARESKGHWIKVHQEVSQIPFDFGSRPSIRFILVQSPDISELIILCHHIICDGLSLAYLARDLMVHLGDPTREVEVLPNPVPIDLDNIPKDVSLNPVARFFINRINKKWGEHNIFFDQEDYRNLNDAYWNHFHHHLLSIELSEVQTESIVDRCNKEGVTVNSALAAAFAGAQYLVLGERDYHSSIGVAASIRDRLPLPAGQGMGFFAGVVTLNFNYDGRISFWDNTRRFHQKVISLYTNKNLFKDFLNWCYLEPAILEAINFKKLGGLIPQQATRYDKLSTFSKQDDIVLSLLKRDKMDSLEKKIMGTAVTNLTRLDFPRKYGALTLDRLIINPGGAFPLANINLVLGAVTCAGKLSLVLEYAQEAVDTATMKEIKDVAMEFLIEK